MPDLSSALHLAASELTLAVGGLVLAVVHWLWSQGPKWAVGYGWLTRPPSKVTDFRPTGGPKAVTRH